MPAVEDIRNRPVVASQAKVRAATSVKGLPALPAVMWPGWLACGDHCCLVSGFPATVATVTSSWNHLIGPVGRALALRAEDPGFDSCVCCGDIYGTSHTSDLKIGTPVAALPGAWCYRISTWTGWHGVSIL